MRSLQPLEFKAGQEVVAGGKEPTGESAGGLFSGASGPKPPPALSQAVMGMKPGGKVLEANVSCHHNICGWPCLMAQSNVACGIMYLQQAC